MSLRIVGIRKVGKSSQEEHPAVFLDQSNSEARTVNSAITWCGPGSMMTVDNARLWPCSTALRERTRMAAHQTAAEEASASAFSAFVGLITLERLGLKVGE
jgi:hypothetical protein